MAASDNIIYVNTSAARTLTLPAPTDGRVLKIKDSTGSAGTNNITINPNVSETIDGASSYTINNNFGSVDLMSNGVNWFVETSYPATASVTFPLLAPAGSAGAPSYSFSGDSDTGIFSPGANSLSITVGGSSFINFSGGTINPAVNTAGGTTQATFNSVIIGDAANTISATNVLRSTADMTVGPTSANNLNFATNGSTWMRTNSTGNMAFTTPGSIATNTAWFMDSTTTSTTGTQQQGLNVKFIPSSAATSSVENLIQVGTAASTTHTTRICLELFNRSLAAGAAVTNDISLLIDPHTQGSQNVSISDTTSIPSSQNLFIYQSGTVASILSGMANLQGGLSLKTRTVTTTATVGANDSVILCNQSAGFTLTLPAAADGRVLIIKDFAGNSATNNITVARAGSDVIDGATSYVINVNYASITLVGSSGNWSIV